MAELSEPTLSTMNMAMAQSSNDGARINVKFIDAH